MTWWRLPRISGVEGPPRRAPQRTDRALAWHERNQFFLLGLAGLLLLGGLLIRDLREDAPPALVLRDPQSTEGRIVVHIAGVVLAPGVYELPAGARIRDAVAAAGGPGDGADLDALNLARPMRDGERIEVPGASAEVTGVAATLAPGQKLDLNAATMEQLDQLPGIGEAYSRRIVDSRTVDGPYLAVEDLVARRVIPAATLDEIRDRVTVSAP